MDPARDLSRGARSVVDVLSLAVLGWSISRLAHCPPGGFSRVAALVNARPPRWRFGQRGPSTAERAPRPRGGSLLCTTPTDTDTSAAACSAQSGGISHVRSTPASPPSMIAPCCHHAGAQTAPAIEKTFTRRLLDPLRSHLHRNGAPGDVAQTDRAPRVDLQSESDQR